MKLQAVGALSIGASVVFGFSGVAGAASTGAAAVAKAEAFVKPYTTGQITWHGPTSSPPAAKNKKVIFLDIAPTDEAGVVIVDSAKQAASALGWNFSVIDATKTYTTAVEDAIAQKPDGVLLEVADTSTEGQGLADLHQAGIPTVDFIISTTPDNTSNPNITHIVNLNYPLQGELQAAAAVITAKGDANVGMFLAGAPVNNATAQSEQGIKSYFAKYGGGSITATDSVSPSATFLFSPQLGQAAVAFAQSNPQLNVIVTSFDGMAKGVVPALKTAGLSQKVSTISEEGDTNNLALIRSGAGQVADTSPSFGWATWAAFDDFNRVFNHVKPPTTDGVPIRLLMKGNLPPAGQGFEGGNYNYKAKYEKLWGVGG